MNRSAAATATAVSAGTAPSAYNVSDTYPSPESLSPASNDPLDFLTGEDSILGQEQDLTDWLHPQFSYPFNFNTSHMR
jgi:hypothetical protein